MPNTLLIIYKLTKSTFSFLSLLYHSDYHWYTLIKRGLFFFLIHPISPPPSPEPPGSLSLSAAGTAALWIGGSPGSPPSAYVSGGAEMPNAAPAESDVSDASPAAPLAVPPVRWGRGGWSVDWFWVCQVYLNYIFHIHSTKTNGWMTTFEWLKKETDCTEGTLTSPEWVFISINIKYINISQQEERRSFTSWASWALSCFTRNLSRLFSLCSQATAFSFSLCRISCIYLLLDCNISLVPLPGTSQPRLLPPRGKLSRCMMVIILECYNPPLIQTFNTVHNKYNISLVDVSFFLTLKRKQNQKLPVSSCLSQTGLFQSGPSVWTKWQEIAVMPEWQKN